MACFMDLFYPRHVYAFLATEVDEKPNYGCAGWPKVTKLRTT